MPEYKQHVLVCDVVRDDERHCGDKGGGDVKKKFAEVLAGMTYAMTFIFQA